MGTQGLPMLARIKASPLGRSHRKAGKEPKQARSPLEVFVQLKAMGA